MKLKPGGRVIVLEQNNRKSSGIVGFLDSPKGVGVSGTFIQHHFPSVVLFYLLWFPKVRTNVSTPDRKHRSQTKFPYCVNGKV